MKVDRFASPLRPPNLAIPSRSLVFFRLRRSTPYQTFRNAFWETANLPLYLEPGPGVQGALSPEPEIGHRNGFCRAVNPAGSCLRCCMSRIPADAQFETESSTWTCQAGLQTSVVPILVDPTPIAWLITGQVRVEDAERPVRGSVNTPTPVMPASRYAEIIAALESFAQRLSGLVNALIVQTSEHDTPLVARTKSLLRLEAESIDHGWSAQNPYDFDAPSLQMLFEKETGLSMEEFVLRCRIEKARRRLMETEQSNEALAACAGYDDTKAFVRDFECFVGQNPREHRARMQACGAALQNWLGGHGENPGRSLGAFNRRIRQAAPPSTA